MLGRSGRVKLIMGAISQGGPAHRRRNARSDSAGRQGAGCAAAAPGRHDRNVAARVQVRLTCDCEAGDPSAIDGGGLQPFDYGPFAGSEGPIEVTGSDPGSRGCRPDESRRWMTAGGQLRFGSRKAPRLC